MKEIHKEIRYYTAGGCVKTNREERREAMRKRVDWEKTIICGVSLGFMVSVVYLLLMIAATVVK